MLRLVLRKRLPAVTFSNLDETGQMFPEITAKEESKGIPLLSFSVQRVFVIIHKIR